MRQHVIREWSIKLTMVLSILVLPFLPTHPAYAATTAEKTASSDKTKEKSAEDLRKDIQRRSEIIKKHENDLNDLKKNTKTYDISIKQVDRKLTLTENKINLVNSQIKELQNQINDLDILIHTSKQQLNHILKQLYMLGGNSTIKIVLGNDEAAQTDRYLTYYKYLSSEHKRMIQSMTADQNEKENNRIYLENKKTELASLKQEYDENLGQLNRKKTEQLHMEEALKSNIETEKNQLNEQKEALKEIEKAIAEQKRELEKKRKEEERKAIELAKQKAAREGHDAEKAAKEEKINFAKRNSLHGLSSNLPWPVKGKVIKNFGTQRFAGTNWTGVLISTGLSTPVSSIAQGDVLYSGWLNGLGNIIVIDHGNDYLAIYANNQINLVKSGQRVQSGDTIARTGNSGGLKSDSLYFEIRKKGVPLNPLKFLKK